MKPATRPTLARALAVWEHEGGATRPGPMAVPPVPMTGSAAQVEWALGIKRQVNLEFDRVATALRAVARRQRAERRDETYAILRILEEKRTAILDHQEAGYFIKNWQEITSQVRQMIFDDPRYQAIKAQRLARSH